MLDTIRKLHKLLTPEQRWRYILLQLVFVLTATTQVAGVASLAPFIGLLSNPSVIHSNNLTQSIYEWTNSVNDTEFLTLFALAVMIIIVISNCISALSIWLMYSFAFKLGSELQSSTYRSYLNKEFVFYARKNSSTMVGVLTQEIPRFVYMVMQPFLTLCSQLFIAVIILAGLIFIDATLAGLAAAIVGGGYFLVFKLLKERLAVHGYNLWVANNEKLKLLNESLGGIKEVRLLGTESMYEERLNHTNLSNMRSQAMIGLSSEMPKFIIETIAFCAMLVLAIFLLSQYGNSPKVISILSLYAMAGYKLLPAAQTLFKSFTQIKANGGALGEFYDDVLEGRKILSKTKQARFQLPTGEEIRLENISYAYPKTSSPALTNINLRIPRNNIISLIGYSGAGKSTLADLILGLLPPSEGKMFWGNTLITGENTPSWQNKLGYVPQNIFIIDDSVKANIAFGIPAEEVDLEKVKRAAKMANIDAFIETLPGQYDFVVGERGGLMSGGQRQRMGIARALYHDADILIFDEATSALDSVTESEIVSTITKLRSKKIIIMIAHRLATVKISDMIVLLNDGAIEDIGNFHELEKRSKKFRDMLHLGSNHQLI